ncbi:LysR family transcriptional regulator [uncultured Vagococcus sp.]|jgi:DNA-binding transcriptional LysR family regulator|uniref:LysR family transcriptional regulator n=1 Tax=uncultured Vagococcus sp. TaxID=189676 RepID=UPI00258EBBEC|nr:LysR family transcriptional regulator [uncultured Vagococcus sp.]
MELRKLEIFSVVAYYESVSRAAEELFISQPAVSKVIKEIETEIGCHLFDRVSGRIKLNEEGSLFLKESSELLEKLEELKAFGQHSKKGKRLRVGVSRTIGETVLPKVLKEYQENHTQPFKIYIDNVEKIKTELLLGNLDFACIEDRLAGEEFKSIFLSKYQLIPMSKEKLPEMTINTFLKQPFLLREKGSSLRDSFDFYIRRQGGKVSPIIESISNDALIKLAIEGVGITILPNIIALPLIEKEKLFEVKVENLELVSENHLVYLKNKKFTSSEEVLMEQLVASMKKEPKT